MSKIRNRVREGALLLDLYDAQWRQRINVRRLDVSNRTTCPLGQLFGDYMSGLRKLGIPSPSASLYGFERAGRSYFVEARHPEWKELREEWVRAIAAGPEIDRATVKPLG
jgi:hypothetical protein